MKIYDLFIKMARAIIADSDESGEDPYSLPSSPQAETDVAPAVNIDLTTPIGSQNISGATSSTDPTFFQSVLNEQIAAVRTHKSVPGGESETAGGIAQDSVEPDDHADGFPSSEFTAPGTFHRTVTAFDISMASSATNPATQRQLARARSRAEKRSPWDFPASSDDDGDLLEQKPTTLKSQTGMDGESNGRKKRKIKESEGDKVDLIAFPGSMEGHGMPSTLQFTQEQPRDTQHVDISGDTNAFSTAEHALRADKAAGLVKASGNAHKINISSSKDPLETGGNGVVPAKLEESDGSHQRKGKTSIRQRDSSPDEFAHPENFRSTKSHRRRRVKSASENSGQPEDDAGFQDDSDETTEAKTLKKPLATTTSKKIRKHDESDFDQDTEEPQENYAEEDYDGDFVDKPPKSKRGRPKKSDKVKGAENGEETKDTKKVKGKRGRPKKAKPEPSRDEAAVEDADDTHELTINDQNATDMDDEETGETNAKSVGIAEELLDTEDPRQEQGALTTEGLSGNINNGNNAEKRARGLEEKVTKNKPPDNKVIAAPAGSGKPLFRVGLSKRSRIAPLLKSLKKM